MSKQKQQKKIHILHTNCKKKKKKKYIHIVVIDSPESIKHLHNRISMLDVVIGLKIPQGDQMFGVPNQRMLDESENLMDSIEEAGLKGRDGPLKWISLLRRRKCRLWSL